MTFHWLNHHPDRWRADGFIVRDANGCAVMLCECPVEAIARALEHNLLAEQPLRKAVKIPTF